LAEATLLAAGGHLASEGSPLNGGIYKGNKARRALLTLRNVFIEIISHGNSPSFAIA
jgi:hypothetical protein